MKPRRALFAASGYALRGQQSTSSHLSMKEIDTQNPYTYPQPTSSDIGFLPWSSFNRPRWSIFNRRGHVAYHSQRYSRKKHEFRSQAYSFFLVEKAIERNADIVIMRGRTYWETALPQLAAYRRIHYACNPRSPYLSPGNLKGSYIHLKDRLRKGF